MLMLLLTFAVGMSSLAFAQEESDEPVKESASKSKKKASKDECPVMKAFQKHAFFSGKLNKKAQYFVFLQSAGWCGFCRQEMPMIVESYRKMKKAGVEIILFSCDRTEDDAKNFVREFKIKFPATMKHQDGSLKVPGFTMASGIPHATFVDGQGNVLADGQAKIIEDWKDIIQRAKDMESAAKDGDAAE